MAKVRAEITPKKNPVQSNPTNLKRALRDLVKNNSNYKHKWWPT